MKAAGGALIVAVAVAIVIIAALAVVVHHNRRGRRPDTRIPKVFVRTGPWEEGAVPAPAREAMAAALRLNPGYTQAYFSDTGAAAFIGQHYPQFAQLYASVIPGAYRADIWRLLYLYMHGGVYNDMGHAYAVPMASIISADDEFVCVSEMLYPWGMHNAFIAVYPRHPLILAMIGLVVANVRARDYGENSLDITGPCALGRAFNRFFGRVDKEPLPTGRAEVDGYRVRFLGYVFPGGGEETEKRIVDSAGKTVIACKFKGYKEAMYSGRHMPYWSSMYNARAVYLYD